MKKQPRKKKQWAEEALDALDIAWGLVTEEFPTPSEEQMVGLVQYAPAIAGMNRGVTDKATIREAYEFVNDGLVEDLSLQDEEEPVSYSILFLLAYLDAHVSFGVLGEKKADEIMKYISDQYDIGDAP